MAPLRFSLPPVRTAAAALAIALVVESVLVAALPEFGRWLLLWPAHVLGDYLLFQPLTYVLVEGSPMGVIFGTLIVWSIGGELERSWGRARFLRYALGLPVAAGVASVLLALLWTKLQVTAWVGGGALMNAMLVGFGLTRPSSQVGFWGLPMSGRAFAWLAVAFTGLNAAFAGPAAVVPDAFALLFAWAWLRGWGPENPWLRFRSWQLMRRLSKRSSHLKVISGEKRNMPKDSDKYLH